MKILIYLLFFVVFSVNILGQNSIEKGKNYIKHGLQFQVNDLLNLSNYRGYTISYRRILTENSGLRFGTYFRYRNSSDDRAVLIDNENLDAPYNTNYFTFKFSAHYLYNILKYEDFVLQTGAGPFFTYFKNKLDGTSPSSSYIRKTHTDEDGYSYGADLILGIEYWVYENVAFSIDSGIEFAIHKAESNRIDRQIYADPSLNEENNIKANVSRFSIEDLPVSLGISVFF